MLSGVILGCHLISLVSCLQESRQGLGLGGQENLSTANYAEQDAPDEEAQCTTRSPGRTTPPKIVS